jgi:hypothetical protein
VPQAEHRRSSSLPLQSGQTNMGTSVEFKFRALFALSETTLRIVVMGFVGLSLKESTVSRSLTAREALRGI